MRKLALVLGGGATKGFAHIGILKVLKDNNIIPDLIVGTSMGAIVGGIYAANLDVENLIDFSKSFSSKNVMDFNIYSMIKNGHIMSGKKLKKILFNMLEGIEHKDLKIPFIAVATDINSGEQVNLSKGLVWQNVMASSAIPAVFPFVEIDGKTLCDGGIKNNLAISVAKKNLKDAVVLAIDVIADYEDQVEEGKWKLITNILNMSTLYMTDIIKAKKEKADILIKISQPEVKQMDFNSKSATKAIENGVNAMNEHLEELLNLLNK